jgi:hypothetical protein
MELQGTDARWDHREIHGAINQFGFDMRRMTETGSERKEVEQKGESMRHLERESTHSVKEDCHLFWNQRTAGI